MKPLIFLLAAISILCSCQNKQQSDAKKLMSDIQSTMKANSPGFIPTSKNGYWMSANIDGKEWTASAMLPDDKSDSKRIQGEKDGESIGFYIWTRGLAPGKRFAFSDKRAADLMTHDDVGIWGGRKGEIVITRIDDSALEGTFTFTGSSTNSNKTIQVTNGTFRIPLTPTQ
ncbi:MAG: DUF6252 family protein [Candidatus Pedobacter colombiensis]|uniref:DUF6252 family protein n=1 Tax=Candidatus Pedobacter colombiensis TaxID=3121371 RepID=A0AAJ6B5G5_9SPHI|nr:DUF6252 family protein [Pedobacter sp.]WEK18722.1 MAG: DUF6252 family protein [Pedobacter sp.]